MRKLIFVFCCVVGGSLLVGPVDAAINRSLDYSLDAEGNSEDDDETFSTLSLTLSDNFYGPQFRGEYELESSLFADHDENETNDQYEGSLDSEFIFLESAFWWELDATAEVVPIDTGIEVDEFDSQTVATLTTGPVLSLSGNLRGSVDLAMQATRVQYSDTPLDSTEGTASITYNRPVNSVTETGVEFTYRTIEYDDSENRTSEFDASRIGLFYGSAVSTLEYELRIGVESIEADNSPDDQESYQFDLTYALNSASVFTLEIAETLLTADLFNRLGGSREDSQFEAGLLKNKRIALGYEYFSRNITAGALMYSNKFENVVSDFEDEDDIDGYILYLISMIDTNLVVDATFEHTETSSTGEEEDDLEISITYTKDHTSRLSSSIRLSFEVESFEGEDFDNAGIGYIFTANILD